MKDRHELLLKSIGTFYEEDSAYQRVNLLSWVLPMTISIHAVVDAIIAYVYMKYAHPWRGILADDENNDSDNSEKVKNSMSVKTNHQELQKGEGKLLNNNFILEVLKNHLL